jgi:hypothetical protein
LQLVNKRAGNTLKTIGIGKDFLNRTPAAQQLRERVDKWDYIEGGTLSHAPSLARARFSFSLLGDYCT